MKPKFSNSELSHIWASQSQDIGSNQNGSFYFEDNCIYSYGAHFPIACHINNDIVLMTVHGYSNTTSKHLALVRNSIMHKKVFYVDNVRANETDDVKLAAIEHVNNFNCMTKEFDQLIKSAARARSNKPFILGRAMSQAKQANEYAKYFDILHKVEPISTRVNLDEIKEQIKIFDAENKRKAEIKQQQKLRDNARKIKAWLAGESVYLPYDLPNVMLRVKGDNIETSHHANIPIADAVKLWPLIKRAKKIQHSYVPDSYYLGGYSLSEIKHNGDIKVGCHYIRFDELEKIAIQLELT